MTTGYIEDMMKQVQWGYDETGYSGDMMTQGTVRI